MLLHIDGRRVHYDLLGEPSGPVIYFAHALAADSGMWSPQVKPALDAGYQVLRVDMRGHGGSEPTPGKATMSELADDAVAVLDRLQIARVHFCGLSIGGMIGQGVAIRHPDRIRSLVLSDTRSRSPTDAQERWGPRILEVQAGKSMRPLAPSTMQRWLTESFRAQAPAMWTAISETVAATDVQGYASCTAAIQDFDWTPFQPDISAPTLVLCGSDDHGSEPGDNEKIARRVQHGEFREIAGARHLPNVEDAALFNRLLIDWCRRHDPA
jgi:3-oxoadipate enol-lactonase